MSLTLKEQEILENLRMYRYNKRRLDVLTGRLKEITYRMTPAYSLTTGRGGTTTNQVEHMCERKEKIEAEINEIRSLLVIYETAIEDSGLTDIERDVIGSIMAGKRVIEYARTRGMYKNRAYRIRDRALYKISRALP